MIDGVGVSNSAPDLGAGLPISTGGVLPSLQGTLVLNSVDDPRIPDDGGQKVTGTGVFPLSVGMQVRIYNTTEAISKFAYSGVVGQGNVVFSEDGLTITFISPPLLASRGYNIEIIPDSGFGFDSGVPVLTSEKRSFTSNLFSFRSSQADPRNVGPRGLADEPLKLEDV